MCVCPYNRPFVHLSPQKRKLTFKQGHITWSSFLGDPNSLQVIFVWVNQTPGPTGSGLDPKGGSAKSISSQSFRVRVLSHTFLETRHPGKKKCCERNFEFWSTAREKRAERSSWSARQQFSF